MNRKCLVPIPTDKNWTTNPNRSGYLWSTCQTNALIQLPFTNLKTSKFPCLYQSKFIFYVTFSKTISKKTPSLLQLWFPQSFEFVVCWPVRKGFPQLVGAPDHQCNSLIGHVLCAGQCWASSSEQASPHHLGKRTELRALWAPPTIISLGQVGIPMGLI